MSKASESFNPLAVGVDGIDLCLGISIQHLQSSSSIPELSSCGVGGGGVGALGQGQIREVVEETFPGTRRYEGYVNINVNIPRFGNFKSEVRGCVGNKLPK